MIKFLILISVGLLAAIICILNAHKKEIWETLKGGNSENNRGNKENT